MFGILYSLRVFTFAAFIVSNAILCSVGAWSLSIAQYITYSTGIKQVAGYLIFLGAFGLIVVFPLLFVEIMRSDSRTTTVWFELLWTGFFFLLEFIGAVALSAQWPNRMCMAVAGANDAPCQSISVLLAFSWMITIILMLYFIGLLGSAMLHHRDDPQVWRANVTGFPWFKTRYSLPSPKAASTMFGNQKRVSIVAPKPRRPAAPTLFAYRSGMSSEYEVEHFEPPATLAKDVLPVPPIPAQPPYQAHRSASKDAPVQSTAAASFYPQYVQTSTEIKPPAPTATAAPPPPIKPAGDWPRPDTSPTQRQKTGRQVRYQNINRPAAQDDPPSVQPVAVPTPPTTQTSAPSPPSAAPAPSAPRTPSTSRYQRSRPPPLDLSAVRAYDSSRSRR